jgi:large subunit ribosomal protein L23
VNNPSDVLLRPIVTEKTTAQLNGANDYAFEVAHDANKVQIKRAIEDFYGVTVEKVRTLIVRGKIKRHGRFYGKRRNWKKAYVRLAEGDTLNVYEV